MVLLLLLQVGDEGKRVEEYDIHIYTTITAITPRLTFFFSCSLFPPSPTALEIGDEGKT